MTEDEGFWEKLGNVLGHNMISTRKGGRGRRGKEGREMEREKERRLREGTRKGKAREGEWREG